MARPVVRTERTKVDLVGTPAATRSPEPVRAPRSAELAELPSKVRIAALWLSCAVAFFAYRTLALESGATEVSMLGEDFATYLLAMMGFAFLALTLPASWNRTTNLIAGTTVGIAQVAMLADGLIGYPSAPFNLMTGTTVVAMVAVVWLAYRWGKHPG